MCEARALVFLHLCKENQQNSTIQSFLCAFSFSESFGEFFLLEAETEIVWFATTFSLNGPQRGGKSLVERSGFVFLLLAVCEKISSVAMGMGFELSVEEGPQPMGK